MSTPWIKCFGCPAEYCNLYHEKDTIVKVIGHANGYSWPVRTGQTLKQFVDDYQDYFNMGISIRSRP